ncbi:hypothetical protein BDN72DRAFT_959509 [Pluteus cervinus]|uniref:Uncharacterized protein n=1 Tax=Pluteus cervinus TaxID=181527 RepID=A0ACD3AUW1_9AGAR|nr:hypothetical protein BDN72DRAFT_959509 [Pluteus cervinus]
MSSAQPNPLSIPSYFTAALETLLESFHDPFGEFISLHDLADAYNTLSHQIRSQACLLLQPVSYPALEPLQKDSARLWAIFRRDIRRCLVDPSGLGRLPASTPNHSISSPLHLSDEHIQFAADLATLCQYALRFASDICILPALYSIFTTHDLHGLLDDILMIVATRSLPTPSAQRTHTLIIWFLQTQTLPFDALEPVAEQIVSALDRGLVGDFGDQAIIDSLRAVQLSLRRHPSLFAVPLAPSFVCVLDLLLSDVPSVRAQAAVTIGAYILSRLDGHEVVDSSSVPIEDTLQSFIQNGIKNKADGTCQFGILHLAVPMQQIELPGDGPIWALLVSASFIVLLGGSIFGQPHSIKFCLSLLAQALGHKRETVRFLQAIVWRCLIWSYFSLRDKARNAPVGEQKRLFKLQERAFLLVKEELRGGIGVSLVSALLANNKVASNPNLRTEDVNKALSVIKDMITSSAKGTQQQGLLLLKAIVDAENPSVSNPFAPRDRDGILERKLFDGSLLNAGSGSLPTMIKSLASVNFSQVRGLTEDEMADHWESLIGIWVECMKLNQKDELQGADGLLDIWRSLLLVQLQLTQERSTGTTSVVASRVASTICRFISQNEVVEVQAEQLSLVDALWSTVQSIFSQTWLSGPAQIIMASILKQNFTLLDDTVKAAWLSLCAKLVSVGIPALLHIISVQSHRTEETEMKRQLWMLLAKTYQDCDETQSWQDLVSFLLIPFRGWAMSQDGYELWEGTLRSSFSLAGRFGFRPLRVIQHLFERIQDQRSRIFHSSPRYLVAVLAHLDLTDEDNLPIPLLSTIGEVLNTLYPPAAEHLALSLEIIQCLKSVLNSIHPPLLVDGLIPLCKGLCLWLSDEKGSLLASELNTVTETVYCTTLDILRDQPPKLDHLLVLTDFFISVFHRVPEPAVGPIAFARFWQGTYMQNPQWIPHYSDDLRSCLKAISYVWSSQLVGCSLSTDSQNTSKVTASIPDSEPLVKKPRLLETPVPLGTSPLAIPTTSLLRPSGQSLEDSYMALLSSSSPPPFGDRPSSPRAEPPSVTRRPTKTPSRHGGSDFGHPGPVRPSSEGMTSLYDPVVTTPPRRPPPSRRESIQSLGLSTPRPTLEPSSPTDIFLYGDEDKSDNGTQPASLKRRRTEIESLIPCLSKGRKSTSEASSRGVSFLIPGFSSPPRPSEDSPALPVHKTKSRPAVSQKDDSQLIPGINISVFSRRQPRRSRGRSPQDPIPPTSSGVTHKFKTSSPVSNPWIWSSPPPNRDRKPFIRDDDGEDQIESWEASELRKLEAGVDIYAFPPSDDPHIPTSEMDMEEVNEALSFGADFDKRHEADIGEDITSRSDISPRNRIRKENDRQRRRSRTAPIPFSLYPPSHPAPSSNATGTGAGSKRKRLSDSNDLYELGSTSRLQRSTSISVQSRHQAIPRNSRKHPQPRPHPHQYLEDGEQGPKKKVLRLDALETAYAAIAGQGASQIPVQDLMHATRLVNKLGQALTERMSKKIGVGPAGVDEDEVDEIEESLQEKQAPQARGKTNLKTSYKGKGKGKERARDDVDEEGY